MLFLLASAAAAGEPPSPVPIGAVPFVNITAKIVDDMGRGPTKRPTALIRLRAVLPGLVYRAGRNEKYIPYMKNRRPPTQQVLESLCASGFRHVYFLYADPLPMSPVACARGLGVIQVPYEQARVVLEVDAGQKLFPARDKILAKIFYMIMGGRREPILLLDRAGLHATGYIAAIVLRQFCGMDGPLAIEYWTVTANKKSAKANPKLLDAIREFTPLQEYRIDQQHARTVCPQLFGTLADGGYGRAGSVVVGMSESYLTEGSAADRMSVQPASRAA